MAYKPIESYGVVGDLHSVALVGMDGSIDWLCLPHFDSPSIFASILDDEKGGYFRIQPKQGGTCRQMYLPDTNVLLTRFLGDAGVAEIVDFMPIHGVSDELGKGEHQVVRVVRAVRGSVEFRLECVPAFDFARQPHATSVGRRGAVFEVPGRRVGLVSRFPLSAFGNGVAASFRLEPGESATFILRDDESSDHLVDMLGPGVVGEQALARTVEYWRRWIARCRYAGRWREMVHRSALVLKLLTFQPTGAIVAAPTTSLPEEIGGTRNWDYRYTWIRDATWTLYAFLRLGYSSEAGRFMDWLAARTGTVETAEERPPLNIMYGIDGRCDLTEESLAHLEGYRGSRPIRVGNGAAGQLQLDIYGELMDAAYLYDKYGTRIAYDHWTRLRGMVEWVADHWDQPDEGIWEVRGGPKPFTFSKLQVWVAIDRAVRLARKRSLPIDRQRLLAVRDEVYEAIMTRGWSERRGSFVQYFGTDALDASNLLMPLVLFISPTDPRMTATIDRTIEELASDSLVHRYEIGKGAGDGLSGREGTFSICTFWLVEALGRAGRLDSARFIFEKMLTYANHLGLYSEEIGASGEALGNFPQAFTHLGLISAAYDLDRRLDQRR